MAFETLTWLKKLWKIAKSNGSSAAIWTTPNNDLIHIYKKKVDVIEVKTTHLGKISIGIGEGQRADYKAIEKALAPSFVHSYDAAVLKSSFKDWHQPIALVFFWPEEDVFLRYEWRDSSSDAAFLTSFAEAAFLPTLSTPAAQEAVSFANI